MVGLLYVGKMEDLLMLEQKQTFMWHCHPEAEQLVEKILSECIKKNSYLKQLQEDLLLQTSSRLFDWVDHVELGVSPNLEHELIHSGFTQELVTADFRSFHHLGAQLPRVVVRDEKYPFLSVAISVESIADFLMVRGQSTWIEGSPLSNYRRALVAKENGVFIFVVERRATGTMEPTLFSPEQLSKINQAYELWQTRTRHFFDDESELNGLKAALVTAEEIVELVGKAMGATIILDVERKYWQSKNRAAQIQKNRQDSLGMGWANHDHHTFRSSRKYFSLTCRLFEILGFQCRERFYAGREAGWGAQVMEHPEVRLVLFIDVDLAPSEVAIDFAHHPLPELSKLGTVGLWCALHGESILGAGMHHLEAQFIFDKLRDDLQEANVSMMAPFSNFPHLKQAFTVGQMWKVAPHRIIRLLEKNLITEDESARFELHGAIGSHLENLQRKEGFKGFNQKTVSDIIGRTDPRTSIGA